MQHLKLIKETKPNTASATTSARKLKLHDGHHEMNKHLLKSGLRAGQYKTKTQRSMERNALPESARIVLTCRIADTCQHDTHVCTGTMCLAQNIEFSKSNHPPSQDPNICTSHLKCRLSPSSASLPPTERLRSSLRRQKRQVLTMVGACYVWAARGAILVLDSHHMPAEKHGQRAWPG